MIKESERVKMFDKFISDLKLIYEEKQEDPRASSDTILSSKRYSMISSLHLSTACLPKLAVTFVFANRLSLHLERSSGISATSRSNWSSYHIWKQKRPLFHLYMPIFKNYGCLLKNCQLVSKQIIFKKPS